jgi:uncharacterized protein (DUF1697 family)
MAVFIALLRAVNVGGTGKLSMPDLKTACEKAGLERVSTYIASGNLVFETDKSAPAVKTLITQLLRDRFGLAKNHSLIRTPRSLASVIAGNPFAAAATQRPNRLMINFLDGPAPAGLADALSAYRGPERLRLDGEHLYVDYAQGIARSKLTPFLDKTLKVPATARNWNTTNQLLEMARARSLSRVTRRVGFRS